MLSETKQTSSESFQVRKKGSKTASLVRKTNRTIPEKEEKWKRWQDVQRSNKRKHLYYVKNRRDYVLF